MSGSQLTRNVFKSKPAFMANVVKLMTCNLAKSKSVVKSETWKIKQITNGYILIHFNLPTRN